MRVSVTSRTAVYGPVRTVVWEGRSREAPPYPDLWRKADMKRCRLIWRECPSRHNECYDAAAGSLAVDVFAGHQLNDRPFLPKKSRRLVHV